MVSSQHGLRRAAPWALCAITLAVLVLASWLRWTLRDEPGVADEEWLEGAVGSLGVAGIPVVGALIAARLPTNPYGWLWCAVGLAYAASEVPPLVRVAGGPPAVAWLASAWGFGTFLCLMVFVFLLFPTGHLPSRSWRWLARAAVTNALLIGAVVPFTFDPDDPVAATSLAVGGAAAGYLLSGLFVLVTAMFVLVLAAMVSLVLRFRRAGPVERQQLTWFLYATGLIASYLVVDGFGVVPPGLLHAVLNGATFAVLPLAVGVAVFRYRLYEIDRIVSRTVSYGLLTGALVVLYLGLVTVLQPLLEPLTGSSALAVAASTLAVAAVFHPFRRRLQSLVDRRFDRARYDAARAVDAFAARLRDQVDLDEITAGLRNAVTETVTPTRIGVWLSGSAGPRKA